MLSHVTVLIAVETRISILSFSVCVRACACVRACVRALQASRNKGEREATWHLSLVFSDAVSEGISRATMAKGDKRPISFSFLLLSFSFCPQSQVRDL